MIRLHRSLERGLRHPVIGPPLLLVLVVLVALTAVHETHGSISSEIGQLCVGIVLVLLSAVITPALRHLVSAVATVTATRGPPRLRRTRSRPVPVRPDILPLRL